MSGGCILTDITFTGGEMVGTARKHEDGALPQDDTWEGMGPEMCVKEPALCIFVYILRLEVAWNGDSPRLTQEFTRHDITHVWAAK